MLHRLTQRLQRSRSARALDALRPLLVAADAEQSALRGVSDGALADRARALRAPLAAEPPADALLATVLALGAEASRRALGLAPRPVQLMAAVVMHRGGVAEMRTGEGKTLAASLAALPDALMGGGVHVVTTNEYLASRDAEWMGPLFRRLGLEVAAALTGQTIQEKRRAYGAGVTYASRSEVGFDYLRDNLRYRPEHRVQRGRRFALLDEIDSILIDDARTPLIVGRLEDAGAEPYVEVTPLVEALSLETDFAVDPAARTANLTDEGTAVVEARLGALGLLPAGTLYDAENAALLHVVHQCLAARALYQRDVQYTVTDDGQVSILDAFTGRTMAGRRWSDGLHQAIEAKERLPVRPHQRAQAACSYRSLFAGYVKLAGMSGTTAGVEEELEEVHGLAVVHIPPHRPVVRVDHEDALFATEAEKLDALVGDVAARHRRGQPVLVGAPTEALALELTRRLARHDVKPQALLARHHAEEAAIVARAGMPGAVTVATQLAGRGTDILLGGGEPDAAARVAALGGLYVVGVERHRSRRVDDQLRGRSGRQGDPGESRFYVSLEDGGVLRRRADAALALREALEDCADARARARLEKKGRALVAEAQALEESLDAEARRKAREMDAVVDAQREALYALRDGLLRGTRLQETEGKGDAAPRSAAKRPDISPFLEKTREPLRRLIAAHVEHAAAGVPAVRPRMLAQEIYRRFGVALEPASIPRSPEGLHARLLPRVAASLRFQDARLGRVIREVARAAVEDARWGEPGARQRLAVDLASIGVPLARGSLQEATAEQAVEVVRAAIQAPIRDRMRRERALRVLRYFRLVYLRAIDDAWREHLGDVLALRDGIGLRTLAGDEPARALQREAHEGFLRMERRAEREAVASLLAAPPLDLGVLRRLEDAIKTEAGRHHAPRGSA